MALVLIFGLGVRRTIEAAVPFVSVSLENPPTRPKPPKPPPPPPPKTKSSAPKDKSSARNVRNQATQVVAPPVQPIIVPPPVATAPDAGIGAAANTGASNVAGPGEGAGGIGNGNGGGGNGEDGDGDGDGDSVVGPRQVSGKLRYQDLPEGTLAPGQEASVDVLYRVERDGHVTHCRVEHSSRVPVVDTTACRLIEERFRFKPALDENGRPVSALVSSTQTWVGREER